MRRFRFAAMALALLVAACADTGEAETGPETTTRQPTNVQDDDRSGMEAYLVAVSNILGEADNSTESCEEELSGTLTEDEFRQQGFAVCFVGIFDATTSLLAELVVPQGLELPHEDYLASRRAWSEVATPLGEQLDSFEDVLAILADPDFIRTNDAVTDTCRTLESAAGEFGFSVSLNCDGPAPSDDDDDDDDDND